MSPTCHSYISKPSRQAFSRATAMTSRFIYHPANQRRRDRHGKRDHRYGAPGELYFENLTIQPRKVLNYHSGDMVDPRLVRRLPMCPELLEDEDSCFRSGSAKRRFGSSSFVSAIKQLHKEIEAAEQVYFTFHSKFESDISNIKAYASQEILADLWDMKINGGRIDGRRSRRNEDGGTEVESRIEEFESTGTKILNALDAAISARFSDVSRLSKNNDDLFDTARRFQRKIYVAGEQIDELLSKASRSREYCKNLVHELDFLKELVNPENGKNKEMFKALGNRESETDMGMGSTRGGWDG